MNAEEFYVAMPYSLEAEQQCISTIFCLSGQKQQDALDILFSIVNPSLFYDPRNRCVITEIGGMRDAGQPIDCVLITQRLKDRKLERICNGDYVKLLANNVVNTTNLEAYAITVKTKSQQRAVISECKSVIAAAACFGQNGETDTSVLFESLQKGVFETVSSNSGKKTYSAMGENLWEAYVNCEKRNAQGDSLTGLPCGIDALDYITNGFAPDTLIIIAARPSMGKTALAVNFLSHISEKLGVPAGFFSMEMSKQQISNRYMSLISNIGSNKIKRAKLSADEWDDLRSKVESRYEMPFFVDDSTGLTLSELKSKARRMVLTEGVRIIAIDYLTLLHLRRDGPSGNRVQEVGDIARGLKDLAREMHIPVICLSQLSRAVEGREGKRPQLSDLKESGDIEAAADIVIFPYRQGYYDNQKVAKGNGFQETDIHKVELAELIIAKHRDGEVGMVKCSFIGSVGRFTNVDAYEQQAAAYNETNFNPDGNMGSATVATNDDATIIMMPEKFASGWDELAATGAVKPEEIIEAELLFDEGDEGIDE